MKIIELKVEAVALDWKGEPVIVLREVDGQRAVFIWAGVLEANAINLALEKQAPPRPVTHDLIVQILEHLEAQIERVVISDIRDVTYYATLELRTAHGACTVDCRPVDGIAIALRSNTPVFIDSDLLDRLGTVGQDHQVTVVNPGEPTVH